MASMIPLCGQPRSGRVCGWTILELVSCGGEISLQWQRRAAMAHEIVHRDSAKTAPHCKGFVRSQLSCAQFSRKKRKPRRFGSVAQ
jgi:hypothetical protein